MSAEIQTPPDVLKMDEAVALLRLCRKTIVKLAKSGEIPARLAGNQWRFSRRALLDWCHGNRPA